jgi:hypothetical protein
MQALSVTTLPAKNACASPEVFLRLYGTRGVSPTVKLSECAAVSSVLFLPGACARPQSRHFSCLTPQPGACDSFVVHLPDIGAFTKLAVWISEPKLDAVAGDAWHCDRIVMNQQNKTENAFSFVVGKACTPKSVVEARPSTSATSPPPSPARAVSSHAASLSLSGAATTRTYGDGQGEVYCRRCLQP